VASSELRLGLGWLWLPHWNGRSVIVADGRSNDPTVNPGERQSASIRRSRSPLPVTRTMSLLLPEVIDECFRVRGSYAGYVVPALRRGQGLRRVAGCSVIIQDWIRYSCAIGAEREYEQRVLEVRVVPHRTDELGRCSAAEHFTRAVLSRARWPLQSMRSHCGPM
jgi:hypothetical protein